MADSTVADVSKMKVVELRKELKARGLPHTGDKAELVARLQSAMSQDDINLDWEDLDSDGVLEDEDEKSHADILDEPVENVSSDDLALAEQPSQPKTISDTKPAQRTLKRKITASDTDKNKSDAKSTDGKDNAKKIILNRAISVTTTTNTAPEKEKTEEKTVTSEKVRITADLDPKTRLEMRAKRFGIPVQMTEAERKEARKQRFNQNTTTASSTNVVPTGSLSENLSKLKKRAERFGQSVSKIMTDIENKEKLEKRKEKFQSVK